MKKINLGILFFVFSTLMLLAYYGCKKDKNSNQIENSSGNIDMTINGVAWSPATLYASKSGEDMMVYGTSDNGKEFSIKLSSVSTGSFVIGEDNGSFFSDGQNYFRTGDLGTDTIVISAFDNNMIEGKFDLLLIKQGSERDTSGYVQLKGSFHVEQFFNNPYGWDRGKVSFYKTAESCDVMVRINMFSKGGGSNETPIAGPSPYLTFNFTEIPECEYGGYNLDMAPLTSRSGFDFRILPEGDYSIQIVTPDDNMNWTKIIAEDVVKIEKQKCILYEVKCDTGNMIKVITKPVTGITDNSAITGGEISYDGIDPIDITNRGVEYVAINPNYGESHTENGSGLGEFTSNLTDLHSATEYKVRAYCYDFERGRYYYGDWILFQTTGGGSGITVITKPVTNIFFYTAQSGGEIINSTDEILDISMRGICWSWFFDEPTIEWCDSKTEDGAGNGSYQSTMDSLSDGGHYYVRAYAISNSGQVYYGNVIEFSTLSSILILKVDNVTDTFYVGSSAGFGLFNSLYFHYVYDEYKQGSFNIYPDSQTSWAATTYNFDHTCLPAPFLNFSRFELLLNGGAWYSYQPVECVSGLGFNSNGDLTIDIFNNDSIVGSFNAELFEEYNYSNTISISGWFKVYRYNR